MEPLMAMGGDTRVYISVSVGGAVVVGGAFIAWGLTYGTRVSRRDPGRSPLPSLAYAYTEVPGQTSNRAFDRFPQSNPGDNQPLAFEVPLFIYHW